MARLSSRRGLLTILTGSPAFSIMVPARPRSALVRNWVPELKGRGIRINV